MTDIVRALRVLSIAPIQTKQKKKKVNPLIAQLKTINNNNNNYISFYVQKMINITVRTTRRRVNPFRSTMHDKPYAHTYY